MNGSQNGEAGLRGSVGVATYLEDSVNNGLTTYVVNFSDAVIAQLVPVAVTVVTVYVIWTGFSVMRGETHDSVTSVIWRWFRVAMIAGLCLSGPQYRNIVMDGLIGLQGAFGVAFGVGPTIGSAVDGMIDPYIVLTKRIFTDATIPLVPDFGLYIAGVVSLLSGAIVAIIALGIYLVAKISLALLLAVGPAFIFCAMFPSTQRYTESWLSSVLGTIFTNVLIMAVIAMIASILKTACNNIIASNGVTSILADVFGLAILSIGIAFVVLHIHSLGAALAGSISLGNPGLSMLGAAMGMTGMRGLAGLFGRGSGKGSLGEFISTGKSRTPSTQTPSRLSLPAPANSAGADLYQRGVIERLQRPS